jgi:hypothetical protein
MADLQPIPLAGFHALDNTHLIPLPEAIVCSDGWTDDDSMTGRCGHRSALPSSITGSGTVQFFNRFRPSAQSQRFVAVIGGNIYLITEPTSETASDGSAALLMASAFGASDQVCGAQLNSSFYLVNNTTPAVAYRITSDYTIHALLSLPQAAVPTFTLSTLAVIPLHGLSTTGSTLTIGASGVTGWDNISGTIGNVAIYTFASTFDWSEITWLMVACSPETLSGGGGTFKVEIGTVGGSYVSIATVSDPPNTNGSPWVLYGNLQGLDPTVLSAINKIRFTQLGPTTDPFSVYGVMPIPTAPEPGTVNYYVTYFNSVTGVESVLSTALPVVYNNNGVVFPTFLAGHWNYNSFQNIGVKSSNPDTQSTSDEFNKGIGLAHPTAADFASVYTFTGTIPSAAQFPNADTVRLYRSTAVGISLVGSSVYSTDGTAGNAKRADGSAWTTGTGTNSDLPANVSYWQSSGTTWAITDNTGSSASANSTYQAGGPFPPSTQMTAYQGRLVSIYQNQVNISSFTPVGVSTNPVPEWPPIALIQADGWSFDVSPSPTEIGLCVNGDGDALYIGTSASVRSMSDVTPDSPTFTVLRRGVIGRQAYGYFEDKFFWCAWDGIYMSANQSNPTELSERIRTYYLTEFLPDASLVMAYQERKLFVFKGQNYLRYDFVKQRWSTGTIADSAVVAHSWSDVTGVQNNNFVVDTFTGGPITLASHTPDVGGAWTHMVAGSLAGTADVGALNNVRAHNALPDEAAFYYNAAVPLNADYNVSMQIYVASAGIYSSPEICGRMLNSLTVSGGTYYGAYYNPGTGKWVLEKMLTGTPTTLGTFTQALTVGHTYQMELVMVGNQISLMIDNVTVIGPVTDSGISAANFAGLQFFNNNTNFSDTTQMIGRNFTAGQGQFNRTRADQFWFVSTDRFIGRWQPNSCFRDMQIGTDTTTGSAIPDWVYRTGFQMNNEPWTPKAIMLDSSGPVQVQLSKVANAVVPVSARNLFTTQTPGLDECWFPGASDLRGYKISFQFTGANLVTLRRAMYEAEVLKGTKGG